MANIWEAFKNLTSKSTNATVNPVNRAVVGNTPRPADNMGIMKSFIPNFLWKPPFGFPRRIDTNLLKNLSKTPYTFSVKKTLTDEVSSLDYGIFIREDITDTKALKAAEEDKKDAEAFFQNPNRNNESWESIQRASMGDLIDFDSGVIVKVFNQFNIMKEIYARDGLTFLKNPDIYGAIGNRDEVILPINRFFGTNQLTNEHYEGYFNVYASDRAAYFQYGWTAAARPVPFGKREIVYLMQNPRTDSVYGRSVLEIAADIILTMYYGLQYNLDWYINSGIPEGLINVPGIPNDELQTMKDQFEDRVTAKDGFDNTRRIGHKLPWSNAEKPPTFVGFNLSPKELMIIQQQDWFIKLLWMNYGVTPDEMGFTEQSNRAISEEQTKVFKRKAIRPISNTFEYHMTTEILPEFSVHRFKDNEETGESAWDQAVAANPLVYRYIDNDIEDDIKKTELLEKQINMGVLTSEMAAEQLDINVEELNKSKKKMADEAPDLPPKPEEDVDPKEDKSKDDDKDKAPTQKSIKPNPEMRAKVAEFITDLQETIDKV
jgi:hypothetical protein